MKTSKLLAPLALVSVISVLGCEKKKEDAAPAPAPTPSMATAADEIPALNLGGGGASAPTPPMPKAIPAPADVAAPPADAQKSASGLASKVIKKGDGKAHPTGTDRVKVNYTGWTKNGEMFDSSIANGEPITFPLNGVIPGWTEGLQLMVAGETRRLWIPAKLAYGDKPRNGAPAGDLTFDVELLEITAAPKPPPAPEDVKGPPASAKKTASGLAYRLLSSGKPDAPKPTPADGVRVNYTGWTTDGKMFDSTIVRGEPAAFGVGGVIPGWSEGLQLMKVGDKMRFWIPAALAYGDTPKRPGDPAGMLVFDVELLDIGHMRPRAAP